ncbi:LamG-like jellyroll fold domain-containing protein [Paenibacillus oleatilyticus]|uniref:LamG-like jellyroll fold domain-containing protein n=1 Tax=Paenibacillus oleatilyticus TaxID=2594886 RepID=UPI001C1FA1BF|nr:LamG-like jellyroll fold domain-containing protein [Paenibacillus oleatilyticus]MBU7316167.1 discoidin domain-containing protein [Paenibacillus oleatilyticus]
MAIYSLKAAQRNMKQCGVSWYRFNETGGNVINDSKGANSGTAYGTVIIDGVNGKARKFNGTSDCISFNSKIIPLGKKSIRFRIRISGVLSTVGTVLNNGLPPEGSSANGDYIYIQTNGNIGWTSYQGTTSPTGRRFTLESTKSISDGQWHDILCVWDGSTNRDTVAIYIDDMLTPHVTTTAASNETTTQISNLTIGRTMLGNYYQFLNGDLDEIEIYSDIIYPYYEKILILSNGEYKKYDGVSWITVTSNAPTEEDFINNGMDSIQNLKSEVFSRLNDSTGKPKIIYYSDDPTRPLPNLVITANYSPIDELDDPELLVWTDDVNSNFQSKTTALPKPRLVIPLQDLNIKGDLKNFTLSANVSELYSGNIIPAMTSNTSPSPYVASASSAHSANYDAWRAFNGGDGTTYWTPPNGTKSGWIKIDLNSPKIISRYSIRANHQYANTASPKEWTFEGSNNDKDWVILDTRINETNWIVSERRIFTLSNSSGYRYYRLNVSSINGIGAADTLMINKIEMMELVSVPVLRVIVSSDSGKTWNTFESNSWEPVTISSLSNVKQNGMTYSEINSLTQDQWKALSQDGRFRFAYYLEQDSFEDTLKVNSLSSTQVLTTDTPTLNSLTIIYDELDKKYSGLMFMDTSQQYYSSSIGEILKYLDMGTMIAGQTSLEIQVKLTNTYPFDVKNIRLWPEHNISGLTIEMSKSNQPFMGHSSLTFDQLLFDQVVDFYIRLTVDPSAQSGGNFDIRVHAEPV